MSFYEDYLKDGSHCIECCVFIGNDVGHHRHCKHCKPKTEPEWRVVTPKLTKTQKRRAQKKRAIARKKADEV